MFDQTKATELCRENSTLPTSLTHQASAGRRHRRQCFLMSVYIVICMSSSSSPRLWGSSTSDLGYGIYHQHRRYKCINAFCIRHRVLFRVVPCSHICITVTILFRSVLLIEASFAEPSPQASKSFRCACRQFYGAYPIARTMVRCASPGGTANRCNVPFATNG